MSRHQQWRQRPPKIGSGCSSGDVGVGGGIRWRRMREIMGQKNEERRGGMWPTGVAWQCLGRVVGKRRKKIEEKMGVDWCLC